ncbi:hypothetical protein AVEN_106947-1 [Araneus ventricosus]|uniref:Uncharacterized protein n=1 Tax=Araneus ventricosus TaxID=182803 RepID=A0A4Y2GIF3_ARAVE|nr:hypothetical protein AVEN_106947-1 [Araneus ventricosus]
MVEGNCEYLFGYFIWDFRLNVDLPDNLCVYGFVDFDLGRPRRAPRLLFIMPGILYSGRAKTLFALLLGMHSLAFLYCSDFQERIPLTYTQGCTWGFLCLTSVKAAFIQQPIGELPKALNQSLHSHVYNYATCLLCSKELTTHQVQDLPGNRGVSNLGLFGHKAETLLPAHCGPLTPLLTITCPRRASNYRIFAI